MPDRATPSCPVAESRKPAFVKLPWLKCDHTRTKTVLNKPRTPPLAVGVATHPTNRAYPHSSFPISPTTRTSPGRLSQRPWSNGTWKGITSNHLVPGHFSTALQAIYNGKQMLSGARVLLTGLYGCS